MDLKLSYLGHSRLEGTNGSRLLSLMPNLSREPVAFDSALQNPLRFREAISALHDVVVNDLRFKPRDKSDYEAWKKAEAQRLIQLRQQAYQQARKEILGKKEEPTKELERQYSKLRSKYWNARQDYTNYLRKHDMELWRLLMPCDPVITVAPDVVFFECFSADESSYGCLTVNRESFGSSDNSQFGTTNVDYSWNLYHSFQALRTYRETRLKVDPAGFSVATQGQADYREEKIDLPPGWLRGFMQIQSAMSLPMRRVSLSREAVYSILAWLKRHKAKTSPRALRFELLQGQSPRVVLEPWEQRITSHGTVYDGPDSEPIRIWGRQRLLVLSRLLPLAESFDVYLLGTGLPTFWVARLGDMRLTVGLSGWTTNDWTRSTALDVLAPPVKAPREVIDRVAVLLRERRSATFKEVEFHSLAEPAVTAAALNHLAHSGQVIYDLTAGVYRWRQVMPQILGEAEIGPENAELAASRPLVLKRRVKLESKQDAPGGGKIYFGEVDRHEVEVVIDADGLIRRGKCNCSHHYKSGIRLGPCRHLLALRAVAENQEIQTDAAGWYSRLLKWTNN